MNHVGHTNLGFKYVGDNYIMYNKLTGENIISMEDCGQDPHPGLSKMWHLLYCYFSETNDKHTSCMLTTQYKRMIDKGE